MIRYVRESFFYGRHFVSDEDLEAQAVRWLKDVANVREHRTIGERPIDRFERDEREALQALASRPYLSLVPSRRPRSRATLKVPSVQVERRSLDVYDRLAEGGR